jgi:hypothetical protein
VIGLVLAHVKARAGAYVPAVTALGVESEG